ncbi:unnamed protein product [Caenorhabditis nigoni]
MLEKLKSVAAETEEIKSSQKRKFDEIPEKLQSIEESIAKIPKFNGDEEKSMMKFKEQIDSLEKSIVLNNRSNEKLIPRKSFVLKHVFENHAANLEKDGYNHSKDEEHFDLTWFMRLDINESHLGFSLFCEPYCALKDEWSIETKLEFKMIGRNNKSVIKTDEGIFKLKEGNGFADFLKLEDMKNDYLIDDELTCEVKVEVLKMDLFEIGTIDTIRRFDESQKHLSDVILVVQDTKLYVQKKYLALHSSYFKTLFFGKFAECQKSEIKLNGIDANYFRSFLELIHGDSFVIEDTVDGILHVADMYDVPTAIRRCENFLIDESERSIVEKLQLALRYNLENLKSKCLSEITEISEIESVMAANLPEMNLSTSQALLQKCIDFANSGNNRK